MRIPTLVTALFTLLGSGSAWADAPEAPEILIAGPKPLFAFEPSQEAVERTVIDRGRIAAAPQQTIDDLLRSVPGFNLFRRTSSLVAHPTAQGVSLRGIGGSGASRALVLLDGTPLHDPFGGWVSWSRIPRLVVSGIEVQPGWGAHNWGGYALSGRVELTTIAPCAPLVEAVAEGGSFDSWSAGAVAATGRQPVEGLVAAELFDTAGFNQVAVEDRGAIDGRASSEHQTLFGKLTFHLSDRTAATFSASYFAEDRSNGTPLSGNSTDAAAANFRLLHELSGSQQLKLESFVISQDFSSTFSSQSSDRANETPALDQHGVPSGSVGAAMSWAAAGKSHMTRIGSDLRWAGGTTNEDFRFMEGEFTRTRKARAEQIIAGAYLTQTVEPAPGLVLSGVLRADLLESFDIMRRERDRFTGETLSDAMPEDRSELLISPKLGAALELSRSSQLFGSLYQNVRTPTINELIRPFRVRNDITEANPNLASEQLQGAELGVRFRNERWKVSVSGFVSEVQDPIINLTAGTGPGNIDPCGFVPESGVCRVRRNVEEALARGWQGSFEKLIGDAWQLHGAYLYSDSEIKSSDKALAGKELAQVPRHSGVLSLRYNHDNMFQAVVQLRALGGQFEDDVNSLRLPGYTTVDAAVSCRLSAKAELFVKAENLLDRDFSVARTADGTTTLGTPLFVHSGVRLTF